MSEIKAHDVIEMLRRHYLPESKQPGGIFAPEIQAPGSSRRADLIWQGVTTSDRELVGHEVKVSRADLLAELAEPAKADPWMRYCDRWYLVVSSLDLIEGLDLPTTWGVMSPPSGRRTRSMTVSIKAPKLPPDEQGPALRTLATWLHWRLHREKVIHANETRNADMLRARLHELQNESSDSRPAMKSDVDKLVEAVVRGIGVHAGQLGESWQTDLSVEDVIKELRELGTARATSAHLERQISGFQNRLEGISSGSARLLADVRRAA